MQSDPILRVPEYLAVEDAIFNEIGDLLSERHNVTDEERTEINNRIRNLMRARKKLMAVHHGYPSPGVR